MAIAVGFFLAFLLVTSQGPGTVIDFALELVKQLCNEETSKKVAKGLIYN